MYQPARELLNEAYSLALVNKHCYFEINILLFNVLLYNFLENCIILYANRRQMSFICKHICYAINTQKP